MECREWSEWPGSAAGQAHFCVAVGRANNGDAADWQTMEKRNKSEEVNR